MAVANGNTNELSRGFDLPQRPRTRLVRSLKAWIAEGVLAPGDRVPAERVLAERLNASRDTVRAALRVMEVEGLIGLSENGARIVSQSVRRPESALSHTVAVVTVLADPDLESLQGRTSGWESWLGAGVVQAIHDAGFSVLLLHPDHVVAERLVSGCPHGVIMLHNAARAEAGSAMLGRLAAAHIPITVYGQAEEFPEYDTVYSDHRVGARELTTWLIKQGRKRILRVWSQSSGEYPNWLKQRDLGYEEGMRAHGLQPLPAVVGAKGAGVYPTSEERYAVNVRCIAGFLIEHLSGETPVDALMVASDGPADYVSGACRLFGKEPGRDVLVVGYDNYWLQTPSRPWAPAPPAATVDKLNREVGCTLVQQLLDRVSGRLPPDPQHRLIAPKLIVIGD